jgi:hypothetical protein
MHTAGLSGKREEGLRNGSGRRGRRVRAVFSSSQHFTLEDYLFSFLSVFIFLLCFSALPEI